MGGGRNGREDEVVEEVEQGEGKKIGAGEVSRTAARKRDGARRREREIVWAEQTGIEKEELIKIQIP